MPGAFDEPVDSNNFLIDGSATAAVAVAAGTVVIKAGPGRLVQVEITTAGTASLTFFDNTAASGKVLFVTPATTTVGQLFTIHEPAAIGITCSAPASSAAATVTYS